MPIFALCAALIFVLQWLAFIPAYIRQTEVFYDLTGSITSLSVVLVRFLMSGPSHLSSLLIAGCILVWAFRLGSFLFKRILEDGNMEIGVVSLQ